MGILEHLTLLWGFTPHLRHTTGKAEVFWSFCLKLHPGGAGLTQLPVAQGKTENEKFERSISR